MNSFDVSFSVIELFKIWLSKQNIGRIDVKEFFNYYDEFRFEYYERYHFGKK